MPSSQVIRFRLFTEVGITSVGGTSRGFISSNFDYKGTDVIDHDTVGPVLWSHLTDILKVILPTTSRFSHYAVRSVNSAPGSVDEVTFNPTPVDGQYFLGIDPDYLPMDLAISFQRLTAQPGPSGRGRFFFAPLHPFFLSSGIDGHVNTGWVQFDETRAALVEPVAFGAITLTHVLFQRTSGEVADILEYRLGARVARLRGRRSLLLPP